MPRLSSWAVLTAACVVLGGARPASAAPKMIEPGQVAYVDLGSLLSSYRKTGAFVKYQTQLREKAKTFSEEMELLAQMRYCTPDERNEALMLKAKPKPSEKEATRLNELLKQSDKLDNELASLSQKTTPTAEETARIAALSKLRTDSIRTLAKDEADRQAELSKMEGKLLAEVEGELLKLINQLAKDRKLSTIYERRSVLFGGVDLTEEVVKKLPK